MSAKFNCEIAVIGIDIGKNSFHVVGLDRRGAIVLRQKWSRGQVEVRLSNLPPCLIGMEACVGAHHLSRKLTSLGHDARLMPAKYVRPYSRGQKNDFRDAEAIAEAVQRPTMKFVATKTAEQLDLQALHRVRERLVSQRTGIINQIRDKGPSEDECADDEAAASTPSLSPMTEEAGANLDPVTERLMALMREKGQR
jgi:transposase